MHQPLIILSPLRSCTSVVSAMLGQHPQAHGLPEVNLFIADTVEAMLAMHERRPNGVHGLLRALAEINDGEQNDETIARARVWLDGRRNWSTKEIFDVIRKRVDPRVVIDKSPHTVMQPEFLARAYRYYPKANFLHLTRHPVSCGRSIHRFLKKYADWSRPLGTDSVDPERVWLRSHHNIVRFSTTLPLGQCMRIKAEDLIAEPKLYLPQIAEWLDLRVDKQAIEAMLHPERSPYARPGPAAARYGAAPDFLDQPALRRDAGGEPALDDVLTWAPGMHLAPPTRKLAKEFGYG